MVIESDFLSTLGQDVIKQMLVCGSVSEAIAAAAGAE